MYTEPELITVHLGTGKLVRILDASGRNVEIETVDGSAALPFETGRTAREFGCRPIVLVRRKWVSLDAIVWTPGMHRAQMLEAFEPAQAELQLAAAWA